MIYYAQEMGIEHKASTNTTLYILESSSVHLWTIVVICYKMSFLQFLAREFLIIVKGRRELIDGNDHFGIRTYVVNIRITNM